MRLRLAYLHLIWTVDLMLFLLHCGQSQPQSQQQQQPTNCISNTQDLVDMETVVTDVSQFRSYILCPDSLFQIAYLDYSEDIIAKPDVMPMVPIRSNMEIKCGEDGSKDNNCFIYGGDVQLDATNYFGVNGTSSVDNVFLSGITFSASRRYSVWATRPGNITFHDCVFRMNREALVPIYLDYFDANALETELITTFHECEFSNNVYFGQPAQPALIVTNSEQNRLIVSNSVFQANDLVYNNTFNATNSFLIDASGPLTLTSNCFLDNTLGVAVATVYGNVPIENSNNNVFNSSGASCDFVAVFETAEQLQNTTPNCQTFNATSCQASLVVTAAPSDSPSISPSLTPTISPSLSPSKIPTSSPTNRPTPQTESPSSFPSLVPTLLPSQIPTIVPTLTPSFYPSVFPTKRKPFTAKRIRTEFPTPSPSNVTFTSAATTSGVLRIVTWTLFLAFGAIQVLCYLA